MLVRNWYKVNAVKTKYMFLSQDQTTGIIHKLATKPCQHVGKLRYIGKTVQMKTVFMKKLRENSGNACYYTVQNVLSSRLLSKNAKFKKYEILQFYLLFCIGTKIGISR
jgi:hypothetical protein